MKRYFLLLLALCPLVASAHSGHGEHTFIDGLVHPFLGADHLLAMFLVGAWSVLRVKKAKLVWLAPAVFVVMLAAGALFGQQGFMMPQVESLVAASVLALGLMLTLPRALGLTFSLAVIGGFAVFHGMAHASELSSGSTVLAGIVVGSAVLHGLGMLFSHRVLQHRPHLASRFGQLAALTGCGLLLSAIF